jgi:hypothetical protein
VKAPAIDRLLYARTALEVVALGVLVAAALRVFARAPREAIRDLAGGK